jgi:uncharacterized protein
VPTNVTPAYKKAEAAYRRARDPGERLELLREMLRTIPKHKGTEHLQADIKSKIKELTEDLAGPKKGGARSGPPTTIRPEGAAQVALLGPPNTGKSTLHAALTGSHAETGPFPFTTQFPQPGMLPFEDVRIQLVDLPPISPEHPIAWIGNSLSTADGALLVVDLAHAGCVEEVVRLHEILGERRVILSATWPADEVDTHEDEDPFVVTIPTLLVANKTDATGDVEEDLAVFRELTGYDYPVLIVSASTGEGLDQIGAHLFRALGIVRVYTKLPGQHADLGEPFTVRHGQTVHDVAALVHRDMAEGLRFARLWGPNRFDGQQVGKDHPVEDRDILELHV